ncbi:MAG: phosphatidylserine decarboxylase family protein [Lentisphaeria bacterium]|nr:phosphatidylserine decarboxylase family protein [Lentisphaeria bacterium]
MTLTHYGLREWGGALAIAVILCGCAWWIYRQNWHVTAWIVAAAGIIFFLAIAFFFRNPVRKLPADPLALISPADGVVKDIEIVEDFNLAPFTGKAQRIGIFLSVFNVHINRAPGNMTVESVNYREGEYLDARHNEATKRNEAMTIAGTMTMGERKIPLAVRQISGAIARRIVCPVKPGRELVRGEIYGMIKFGSRTELYLPVDGVEIKVKVGDKVNGGTSILAAVTELEK